MKLTKPFYNICLTFFLAAFCSCQKVIKVNLNSSAPRYVVEGNVTNLPGPYLITINKSVNFDQDNVFPTVSGAIVVITDNTAGVTDSLKETSPGNYHTSVLNGVPGHNYQLYIGAGGNVFTANCTMPALVTLDTLYTQLSSFRGNSHQLVPVYTDPVTTGNYYHFAEIKNDTLTDNISIRNDALINGQVIKQPIGGGLHDGDQVTLTLECIDSAMYQYYFTLEQTNNQNSATPANPLSNIKGGALGYFSAHTANKRSVVVP
jgi:hypothetical protein